MSLNKSIIYKKEYRKNYIKSKAFCKSCRNNGSCSWYKSNRTYKNLKRLIKTLLNE